MARKGEIEVVKEIRDLYDEQAMAETLHINNRKICFVHEFINASLYWSGVCVGSDSKVSVALEATGQKGVVRRWGEGYGAIRFCRHCKHIDCIHDFTDKTYHVVKDEFEKMVYVVRVCSICQRRILATGCQNFAPSQDAHDMLVQVMQEYGYSNYGNHPGSSFGSDFYTLLPVNISRAIRDKGKDAALVQARLIVAEVKKTNELRLP